MAGADVRFPDLTPLLAPRSIAVVGASRDLGKMGGRCVHYLKRHGFPGRIVPVNPAGGEIQGLEAASSIAEIPEGTDCVMLAIGGAQIPSALEACGERGVRAAIVLASGFAETGEGGRAAQDELTRVSERHGILVCGPNSNGLVNVHGRVAATSNPTLDADLLPGGIAVVSQSGGLSLGSMLYLGQRRNIGFNYQISTGNEAGVEAADFAWHCLHDDTTRAIALLVEGFRTPAKILEVAAIAAERGIPITLLKLGRTDAGERIAASHTALLAGSAQVQSAFLERAGIVEVSDVEELYEVAALCAGAERRGGGELGVISPSGGGAILAADMCADAGLPLAALSSAARTAITACLPDFAAIDNPLDLTAVGTSDPVVYPTCLDAMLADPQIGAVLLLFTVNRDYDFLMNAVVERSAASDKPIICVGLGGGLSGRGFSILEEAGIPVFRSLRDGVRAARAVLRFTGRAVVRPADAAPAAESASDLYGRQGESQLYPLLEAAGLPVLPYRVVADVDSAVAAAEAIGFPVVLKGVGRDVAHKSDAGLVRLGVPDGEALRAEWAALSTQMETLARNGARFDGVLVQRHADAGVEAIVGVKHEPGWGSVVVVGLGGVFAEAFSDTAFAPAPLTNEEAAMLPMRLRAASILSGSRGVSRDTSALTELLQAVSRLATTFGERLIELDLNPVIVYEDGRGVVIADAFAVFSENSNSPSINQKTA